MQQGILKLKLTQDQYNEIVENLNQEDDIIMDLVDDVTLEQIKKVREMQAQNNPVEEELNGKEIKNIRTLLEKQRPISTILAQIKNKDPSLIDPIIHQYLQHLPANQSIFSLIKFPQLQFDDVYSIHSLYDYKEFQKHIKSKQDLISLISFYFTRQIDNYSQQIDLTPDLEAINQQLKNLKLTYQLNPKIMYYFLLSSIEQNIQPKIVKDAYELQAIPILYQTPKGYKLQHGIYWVINDCKSVCNVSYGSAQLKKIGKTQFLNDMFSTKFSVNDRGNYIFDQITRTTIDMCKITQLKPRSSEITAAEFNSEFDWTFFDINGMVDVKTKNYFVSSLQYNFIFIHIVEKDFNQEIKYIQQDLKKNKNGKIVLCVHRNTQKTPVKLTQKDVQSKFGKNSYMIEIIEGETNYLQLWDKISKDVQKPQLKKEQFIESILKTYDQTYFNNFNSYAKSFRKLQSYLLQCKSYQEIFQLYKISADQHKLEFIIENMEVDTEHQLQNQIIISKKRDELGQLYLKEAANLTKKMNPAMRNFIDILSLGVQGDPFFLQFAIQNLTQLINQIYIQQNTVLKAKLKTQQNRTSAQKYQYYTQLEVNRLTIALFFREMFLYEKSGVINDIQQQIWDNFLTVYLQIGEPFELLDGEILQPMSELLMQKIQSLYNKDSNIKCISIFGLQSSGKSTTLNFLLRTKFATSNGRCTQGIFCQILSIDKKLVEGVNFTKSKFEGGQQKQQQQRRQELEQQPAGNQKYQKILILDTEGFGSQERQEIMSREYLSEFLLQTMKVPINGGKPFEEDDYTKTFEFDVFVACICLSLSNLTIINIKGDTISPQVKEVLFVTLVVLAALHGQSHKPDIKILLNQVANTSNENITQAIGLICDQLINEERFKNTLKDLIALEQVQERGENLILLDEESIKIAPTAFFTKQTVLQSTIYEKMNCYQQEVNIEYLDKISQLFWKTCELCKKNEDFHFDFQTWFTKYKKVYESQYDRKNFFLYRDHHQINSLALLREIYQNFSDKLQNFFSTTINNEIIQFQQALTLSKDRKFYEEKLGFLKEQIDEYQVKITTDWESEIQKHLKNQKFKQNDRAQIDIFKRKLISFLHQQKACEINQLEADINSQLGKTAMDRMDVEVRNMIRSNYQQQGETDNFDLFQSQLEKDIFKKLSSQGVFEYKYKFETFEETYKRIKSQISAMENFFEHSKDASQIYFFGKLEFLGRELSWDEENLKALEIQFEDIEKILFEEQNKVMDHRNYEYNYNKISKIDHKRLKQIYNIGFKLETKYFQVEQYIEQYEDRQFKNYFGVGDSTKFRIRDEKEKQFGQNYFLNYLIGKYQFYSNHIKYMDQGINQLGFPRVFEKEFKKIIDRMNYELKNHLSKKQILNIQSVQKVIKDFFKEYHEYETSLKATYVEFDKLYLKDIQTMFLKTISFYAVYQDFQEQSKKLKEIHDGYRNCTKSAFKEAKSFFEFSKNIEKPGVSTDIAKTYVKNTIINQIKRSMDVIKIQFENELRRYLSQKKYNSYTFSKEMQDFLSNPKEQYKKKYIKCVTQQEKFRNDWVCEIFENYSHNLFNNYSNKIQQEYTSILTKIIFALQSLQIKKISKSFQVQEIFETLTTGKDYQQLAQAGSKYLEFYFSGKLKNGNFDKFKIVGSSIPSQSQKHQLNPLETNQYLGFKGVSITNMSEFILTMIEEVQQLQKQANRQVYDIERSYQEIKEEKIDEIIKQMCNFKCFWCGKFCDQIGNHEKHQCESGHFYGAYYGVRNKSTNHAVLSTCEQDEIQYNMHKSIQYSKGKIIEDVSWDQIKKRFGGDQWDFTNAMNPNFINIQKKLWKVIGKEICAIHDIIHHDNFLEI